MGRGIDSRNRVWNWVAKLHRLAGRYDSPMPPWFLAPISDTGLTLNKEVFKMLHDSEYIVLFHYLEFMHACIIYNSILQCTVLFDIYLFARLPSQTFHISGKVGPKSFRQLSHFYTSRSKNFYKKSFTLCKNDLYMCALLILYNLCMYCIEPSLVVYITQVLV
jgi:hypothetical protein